MKKTFCLLFITGLLLVSACNPLGRKPRNYEKENAGIGPDGSSDTIKGIFTQGPHEGVLKDCSTGELYSLVHDTLIKAHKDFKAKNASSGIYAELEGGTAAETGGTHKHTRFNVIKVLKLSEDTTLCN